MTQKQLLEAGGVKYYSDSQTFLAEEAKASPKPRYYVFGEWGFIGSFVFLTAGKVPYNTAMDALAIARVPCDTELVILFWGTGKSFGGVFCEHARPRDDPQNVFSTRWRRCHCGTQCF